MELIAPRIFCVGTHHKTGTIWMRSVFRALAQAIGVADHIVFPASGLKFVPPSDRVFLFQWTSRFPQAVLDRPDARVLHVIRDPRDVLLSGMRYHLTSDHAEEAFLHEARDDLGGQSYQQHLAQLPDDTARLMFEMQGKHAETLADMLAWDYARPNGIEARYEDLMADTDCRGFREHLRNLGLTEPEVERGMALFWQMSLFGGQAKGTRAKARMASHVSHGGVAQWRDLLPRAVAEAYAETHGAALVQLGYEDHPTNWLNEVRHAA
ncbi:sulfotransferase domain-containing protein [Jannaschia pohangensis]|uniref:Sulfotransferase domain-containing protein n=1 Tax=Jannaschia pohangensis TaxID=390807 RepID=A0A1I3R0B6_9RHOB|nr:sulfotransferase domain-containing protein [Jannaschia pohangensis]SFJ38951.1 Sulfotransferase domain-containing protein [Jannaschia pohangensis]